MKVSVINASALICKEPTMTRLATFVLAISLSASLFGQSVPSLVNYQGRLTDQNGAPLSGGSYTIQFRLWDSSTNASGLIWAQQQNLTIQSNGVFNVILGAPGGSDVPGPPPMVNDLNLAFGSTNRYLGLTVTSFNAIPITSPTEILPRSQLLAVPYAVSAANAGLASSVVPGSITSASLAVGAVQSANLLMDQ